MNGKFITQMYKNIALKEAELTKEEIEGILTYEVGQDYSNLSSNFQELLVQLLVVEYGKYKERVEEVKQQRISGLEKARQARQEKRQQRQEQQQQQQQRETATGAQAINTIVIDGKTYKLAE